MSGQGTQNSIFAARQRLPQFSDKAKAWVNGANGWSKKHLWGGSRTMWFAAGLVGLAFLLYAIQPSSTPTRPGFGGGRGGFGQPTPVGVATAKLSDVNITLNALGTVNPMSTATVKPQVGGLLLSLHFQEGQMVKKGDLLAEIDPRSIQNSLETARAQLARDSATLANGQLDLKRQQALFEANATSQQVLNQQTTLVRQQEATVRADQASVSQQELNLSYTKVISPIDGRVGLKQVDVGNLVSAGSTNIVTVTQLNPISVVFSMPEDSVREVSRQMAAGRTLNVDAFDRAQTKLIATGRLEAIDNTIDTTTGTVKLRGMFDNTDGSLFPNQFVNVRLMVDTIRDQTVIPSAAVMLGAAGKYVFVVTPGSDPTTGTVSMRTVTTGITDGDNIAITAGLKPGETVVTDGADRLREGAQVTIPDSNAAAAAAAGAAAVSASGGPAAGAAGPAGGAGAGNADAAAGSNAQREMQMAVMQRLTQKERTDLQALDRQERNAKIRAYYNDAGFMKREPDPNAPAFGRGGPGGGGFGGGRGPDGGFGGGAP